MPGAAVTAKLTLIGWVVTRTAHLSNAPDMEPQTVRNDRFHALAIPDRNDSDRRHRAIGDDYRIS